MILLDYSQVIFSQVFYNLEKSPEFSPILIRQYVMSKIGEYNNKFKNKYGQMIICVDSRRGYWRKKVFEYYKWKRKKDKADDEHDWDTIFETMNAILEEVINSIPLMTYHVKYYEADDLIAAICREFRNERHLIISTDGDFAQLETFGNVDRWSPIQKKFLKEADPEMYRFNHIIRGDNGDGIPNIKSPIDFFPRKLAGEFKKQKSVMAKDVKAQWKQFQDGVPIEDIFEDQDQIDRFRDNRKLIDLVKPEDHEYFNHQDMIDAFYEQITEHESKRYNLYSYFVKNRMTILMEDIQDFQNKGDFPKPIAERDNLERFLT